ncbi:MAG: hypothetical protein JSV31_22450 [Desulfobacterales bacterium]|jgi:hypothetical protein|nr:MAG: hypothetical protein JSV31_22450 [Desulfobacterales bacterium]
MKLVSLKRTPKQKKRLRAKDRAVLASEPSYPWGLEINIENETVKKLGIDVENTNAGDAVNLVCKAKITSVSSRKNLETGGSPRTNESISLQITDMAYGVSMK